MSSCIPEEWKEMDTTYDDIYERIITPEYPKDPLELLDEKRFHFQLHNKEDIGTPIQEFYRDATVFITGGSGFLGKSLLEKLLRSCPQIKRIYLLMRPKKNQSSEERITEMLQIRRLRHEVAGFREKISIMNGDLEQPCLGLSLDDRKKFSEEVNIIFHNGASVRFMEKLKLAIKQNVLATREVIKLARTANYLKALVYVSTAYSFPIQSTIEEKIYEMPVHYQEIIDQVISTNDEDLTNEETYKILGKWPNTYTFSKAVAECLITNESQGIPISIFRPSVVVSTYIEPVRGWSDSLNGPFGLLTSIGSGITHVYLLDRNSPAVDMVPVDLVVNCLISIAKETNDKFMNSSGSFEDLPIYLYCSSPHHPIAWKDVFDSIARHGAQWPTIRAFWYYFFITTNNELLYAVLVFIFHTIPGNLFDCIFKLLGRKPRLKKVHFIMDVITKNVLNYFVQNNWKFINSNTRNAWKNLSIEDRKIFFFNLEEMSWDHFFETAWLGARIYLLNDDINTLPAARKKWKRLFYATVFLSFSMIGIMLYLLWVSLNYIYTRTI